MALAVPFAELAPAGGERGDAGITSGIGGSRFGLAGAQALVLRTQVRFLRRDAMAHVIFDAVEYQQRGLRGDDTMTHGQFGDGGGIG